VNLQTTKNELRKRLGMSGDAPTPQGICENVQSWLRERMEVFPSEIVRRYQLIRFANLNLDLYPVGKTSMNFNDELQSLRSVEVPSWDSLAASLRDFLWSATTLT